MTPTRYTNLQRSLNFIGCLTALAIMADFGERLYETILSDDCSVGKIVRQSLTIAGWFCAFISYITIIRYNWKQRKRNK